MDIDANTREGLIRKYRLAGRIRFMTFSLLLLFLLLMKFAGGYSYLNIVLITLIFAESVLNQPYNFILKRVNIRRFQYYQMMTDIIAISWIFYYMGGLEAPIISIAYYAVILWAGVASTTGAVFFAVIMSSLFLSSIVILGHFGILPFISSYDYKMPSSQMLSLVLGNVCFLFAFGYFSARSSRIIKSLERKRQEDELRYAHKLMATGYLVGNILHDALNYLATIKGYASVLLDKIKSGGEESRMLKKIEALERKSADLLGRLFAFSKKPEQEFAPTDINGLIGDALGLTQPLIRYSGIKVEKIFETHLPAVMAVRDQLQEVFVLLILNSLDRIPKEGGIIIKTEYIGELKSVQILFSDTGGTIRKEEAPDGEEAFFSAKGLERQKGLGFATAYGIIASHNGKIEVKRNESAEPTFTIRLPSL